MNSDKFVYYDADFLAKFKKLAEVMEEKDKAVLHRYLIDNFSHIFKVFQYYAREDGNGGVKEFEEADGAMKRELMRLLSFWLSPLTLIRCVCAVLGLTTYTFEMSLSEPFSSYMAICA